jgi:ATP-binding protein involved in chromosome partitioning
MDPELGDNIVDLGMVRSVESSPGGVLEVRIALTTPGCPLANQLRHDTQARLSSLEGVSQVIVHFDLLTSEEKAALMGRARKVAQQRDRIATIGPDVRILAVASGKGGVGKSSIATNLAVAIASMGMTTGLLDADIWGFSIPRMLGVSGRLTAQDGKILPLEISTDHLAKKGSQETASMKAGLMKVVSMGFLAEEEHAIMWRGLLLHRALRHFLEDVAWGDLDYLVIDMPPGTGDVHMGLARMLPTTEVLIVTTPPLAAQKVASRAADMARKGNLRVSGVIENMSGFTCEHGSTYDLFGSGGGERLAKELGVALLGKVPLDPEMAKASDEGHPVVLGISAAGKAFRDMAGVLVATLSPPISTSGCSARLFQRVAEALEDQGLQSNNPSLATGSGMNKGA